VWPGTCSSGASSRATGAGPCGWLPSRTEPLNSIRSAAIATICWVQTRSWLAERRLSGARRTNPPFQTAAPPAPPPRLPPPPAVGVFGCQQSRSRVRLYPGEGGA